MAGGPNLLGGQGEGSPIWSRKQQRLLIFRDGLMHDWAVAVALDMRLKALQRAPMNFADFVTRHGPPIKTSEVLLEPFGNLVGHKVYECISEAGFCFEVDWQIQEVKASSKAFCVQLFYQALTRVVIGNVPDHAGSCSGCVNAFSSLIDFLV